MALDVRAVFAGEGGDTTDVPLPPGSFAERQPASIAATGNARRIMIDDSGITV